MLKLMQESIQFAAVAASRWAMLTAYFSIEFDGLVNPAFALGGALLPSRGF